MSPILRPLKTVLTQELDGLIQEGKRFSGIAQRRWFYGEEGKIFLRVSQRCLDIHAPAPRLTPVIDLATVELYEEYQGKGVFRDVLDLIEHKCAQENRALFVENIFSPILEQSLRRRGYHARENEFPVSLWKSVEELSILQEKPSKPRP